MLMCEKEKNYLDHVNFNEQMYVPCKFWSIILFGAFGGGCS